MAAFQTFKSISMPLAFIASAAIVAGCTSANEQQDGDWKPSRDVTIVVPFDAGGGTDGLARAVASGLEEVRPDITVKVENRPGAGGISGYSYALQQSGDPHQLVTIESSLIQAPYMADVDFTWRDYTLIGQVSGYTGALASPSGRFADLNDVIDSAAVENMSMGVGGLTSSWSLAALMLEDQSQATFERVPYDSSGEAVLGVVSGDMPSVIAAPEHMVEFLASGELDALAVFSSERLDIPEFKDVPTAEEEGVDFSLELSRGLAAAPKIAEKQASYWQEALADWAETDSYEQYIANTLTIPSYNGADAFRQQLEGLESHLEGPMETVMAESDG